LSCVRPSQNVLLVDVMWVSGVAPTAAMGLVPMPLR
jgi:hypothetical protein